MHEVLKREVEELHRFFQEWMMGRLPSTDAAFSRLTGVLHPEFEMVTPGGEVVSRDELLTSLRAAHGSRDGGTSPRGFGIRIDGVRTWALSAGFHLVHYREWQAEGEEERGRLSTALFHETRNTPNGVSCRSEPWRNSAEDLLSPRLETFSRGGTFEVNYTFRF